MQNTHDSFMQRHGNWITVALWAIALSSHAILIPKFIRELSQKKQ
jgi:hypothetical protein